MPSITVTDRRAVRRGAAVMLALFGAMVALLASPASDTVRQAASGAALIAAAIFATTSALMRARREPPSRRRPWWLLAAGPPVAVIANGAATEFSTRIVVNPAAQLNPGVILALLITVAAVVSFATPRRRGADLMVMLLDGALSSVAIFVATAPLLFIRLSEADAGRLSTIGLLTVPALHIATVAMAFLLVPYARTGEKPMFAVLATGLLCYATSDLAMTLVAAHGHYTFGRPLDAGWLLGYLLIGLAAWMPTSTDPERRQSESHLPPALATAGVFAEVVLATVVQAVLLGPGDVGRLPALVWILLLVAAGGRLLLLALDNGSLRRSLERRVAEQVADLRRLVRQREALLSSVAEGIYGVDADGRITFVNPAGAKMLGWSSTDLVGAFSHEKFHEPESDDDTHEWSGCTVYQAITKAHSGTRDEIYRRADGRTFDVESTVAPLVDATGRGAVVVFRNVTQRREVERMKNDFLSVVSHELRTPLTAILASLEMVTDGTEGDLPDDAQRMIAVAQRSSERLARLINDLLDAERIESGDTPLELRPIEVSRLLGSVALQMYGVATQAGIEVVVGKAEGVVMADEDRAMQTLINLIGNAVKFSPPGQQILIEGRQRGSMVRFDIQDRGRGIPEDKLESIFERFAQVDSSDARDLGGTGLGLAICRTIVARHGGTISATSRLGHGTTVTFTLPTVTGAERGSPTPAPVDATSSFLVRSR